MFSTHQRIGENSSTDTGKKTVNDSNDGGGGGEEESVWDFGCTSTGRTTH